MGSQRENERDRAWVSASGVELEPVYGPHHVADGQRRAAGSLPGSAPFLRGAYPEMYRSRDWRIFQLSGFGNPSDMNKRIRFLLDAGETGVIVKHDRMTDDHLYDVDHPDIVERREDVGLTGTVTVGLRDYETIMDGIPLESVYVKPGRRGPAKRALHAGVLLVHCQPSWDPAREAEWHRPERLLPHVHRMPNQRADTSGCRDAAQPGHHRLVYGADASLGAGLDCRIQRSGLGAQRLAGARGRLRQCGRILGGGVRSGGRQV